MDGLRRVALLYNPAAGPRRGRRQAQVEAAAAELRAAGVAAELVATTAPGSAGQQALDAIAAGCEVIVVCGGDGTVHDALQGMVAAGTRVPLGVIPLGTGNGLAAELGIPRNPAAAARYLLALRTCRIAVGRAEWTTTPGATAARYFIISAGAGADAELFYRLGAETKARHGLAAYYAHALRLFWTHSFMPLEVEFRVSGQAEPRREVVAQLLAGRIDRFGGLVSRLTPGASLRSAEMRLVLFHSPRRWPILQHATAAVLRRAWQVPSIEIVSATEVNCRVLPEAAALPAVWPRTRRAARVHTQADGELLGGPPLRLTMVPDALTLLM